MPLNRHYADNAAECRHSIVDAVTVTDGVFVPMYLCDHPGVPKPPDGMVTVCGASACPSREPWGKR